MEICHQTRGKVTKTSIFKGSISINYTGTNELEWVENIIGDEKIEDMGDSGIRYYLNTDTTDIYIEFQGSVTINGRAATKVEKINAIRELALDILEEDDDDYYNDYDD
jgi:hypothetical protein